VLKKKRKLESIRARSSQRKVLFKEIQLKVNGLSAGNSKMVLNMNSNQNKKTKEQKSKDCF